MFVLYWFSRINEWISITKQYPIKLFKIVSLIKDLNNLIQKGKGFNFIKRKKIS